MHTILESIDRFVCTRQNASAQFYAQAARLHVALETGLLREIDSLTLSSARLILEHTEELYADFLTLALILSGRSVSMNPAVTSRRYELSLTEARRLAHLVNLFSGHSSSFFSLTLQDIERFWPLVAHIQPQRRDVLCPLGFLYGLTKSLEALRIGRHSPLFCDRGQILVSAAALVSVRKCAQSGLCSALTAASGLEALLNFGYNDPMLSLTFARLRDSGIALGRVYGRDSSGQERIYLALTHDVSLPLLGRYPIRTLPAQIRSAGMPLKNDQLFSLRTQQGWTSVTIRIHDAVTLKTINLINTLLAQAESSLRSLTDVNQALVMARDEDLRSEANAIAVFLPTEALGPLLSESDFLQFLKSAPLTTLFYFPGAAHAPWIYWQPHPEAELRRGLLFYCNCALSFEAQVSLLRVRLGRLNEGSIAEGIRIAEANYRQILSTLTELLPVQRTALTHGRVQRLTHFFRTLREDNEDTL